MSAFVPEVEGQAKAFASLLARSVREFFQDERHRKEFEEWFDIGEVKRIEKALSDRAAKLDLMVKNDHGNFYLTDLNNCAVAPCPMTLEQIDSWLTDLEKQAAQEDKQ